ncbi:MAG: adenylyl-sulfate kinase [Actinomycetota bacterium]
MRGGSRPLIVAIDGRSGAGKSTLAAEAANRLAARGLPAAVIEGDDFYAGGSSIAWDERTPEDKARHVIDWRRQRPVLSHLRERRPAHWRPFDWAADEWDGPDPPLGAPTSCEPTAVVMLEGAYSGRPELADLVDLRVLLDTPEPVRARRLRDREGEDYQVSWEGRWREAENHYFSAVAPPDGFDLVIT